MRVDTDGRWKQCLAYRSRFDTAAVYLTGWYCDGSGSKPSANALACILDKLVIERELASKEADAFLRGRMTKPALLPGRAGDADHRHRPPRRLAAVALVAAERDVPPLQLLPQRLSQALGTQRGANGFCQPPRPAGARGGKVGFEIVEHDLLLLLRQRRHAVPVGHPLQRVLPLPAASCPAAPRA